jgi:LPXTG-motif cell wall-anchored protein
MTAGNSGNCSNGNESPGTPAGTSTAGTPPTEAARQEVLGARETGGTRSNTKTSPASKTAPASAGPPPSTMTAHATNASSHKSLPYTGSDVIAILVAGFLLLLGGVALQRVLARQAGWRRRPSR